jgi:hypothetical protein
MGPPFLNEFAELKNRPVPITPEQTTTSDDSQRVVTRWAAIPPILYESRNKAQSQQTHAATKRKMWQVPDHRNVSVLQLTLQGMLRRLIVRLGIDFVGYDIQPSGSLVA